MQEGIPFIICLIKPVGRPIAQTRLTNNSGRQKLGRT